MLIEYNWTVTKGNFRMSHQIHAIAANLRLDKPHPWPHLQRNIITKFWITWCGCLVRSLVHKYWFPEAFCLVNITEEPNWSGSTYSVRTSHWKTSLSGRRGRKDIRTVNNSVLGTWEVNQNLLWSSQYCKWQNRKSTKLTQLEPDFVSFIQSLAGIKLQNIKHQHDWLTNILSNYMEDLPVLAFSMGGEHMCLLVREDGTQVFMATPSSDT